jgi:hypothetical protein
MENIVPIYLKPLSGIYEPIINVNHWDEAVTAFDNKEYKASVIEIINYINENLLKGVNTENDFTIVQMQGSAEIQVSVSDKELVIKASFLKITDKTNRIALLRKVAEVNFSPMTLAQIYLKGNNLCFEYQMPIELAQPNKVYDLLWEVSVNADKYDDLFINKYKADFIKTPKIKVLTEAEKNTVWEQIQQYFTNFTEFSDFFTEKRYDDYKWDISVLTLLNISNMPYVHGQLRSDLIDKIGLMFNSDVDYNYRVDKGSGFIKKLMKKSKEEFFEDIYHANHFISLRWRSSEQILSDRLNNYIDTVKKYEKENKMMALSYFLQVVFQKLIYDYNLEDDYKNAIENLLVNISEENHDKAAPKLAELYYSILEKRLNTQKKEKKSGFFSKLFS